MAVPELVVVLLCVLGAGAVVVAISAFGRHFLWKHEVEDGVRDWNQIPPSQASYMKWVREINQMTMLGVVREQQAQARYSGTARTGRDSESMSYYGYGPGNGDGHGYGYGNRGGNENGNGHDYAIGNSHGNGYYGSSESADGRGSSNQYSGHNSAGYVGYEEGSSRHHSGYDYNGRTG